MAGYSLGTARGIIRMDYTPGGAKKAQKDLDNVTAKGGMVGKVMGGAGLAIAAGFAGAINTAANFEKQVSAIGAVSGATGAELDSLRSLALRLGSETSFSASEAANAIEELAKAGIPLPAIMGGAADAAVALAAAGSVSLPEAAAISANAMNQFGLTAAQLPRVVDMIAGAANASAIDVGDFGQSLAQVGAVANLAGVNFDDTATAIALMGNAGIKGSDAGTSLKSMFMRLQPTTKQQANAMRDLGLITKDGTNQFYDQNGKLKSLSQVAGLLSNSLKGMTAEQKQATLQTLFGSDAIRAAAIVSNAGAAGFDNMAASMSKVKAADVAKARLNNLSGAIEQMKGAFETSAIAIGSVLLPVFTKIVSGVTELINKFNGLSPSMQKIITIVLAVSAVLLTLGGGALMLVSALGGISGAFTAGAAVLSGIFAPAATAAGAALSFLMSPITLIVIAIIAVIAILVICYKKFEGFRNAVDTVAAAIKSGLIATLNALQPIFSTVIAGAQKIISTFISVGKSIWTSIQPALDGLVSQIKSFAAVVAPVVDKVGSALLGAFKAVGDFIDTTILPALQKFGDFLQAKVIPVIAAVVGFIMSTVMPILLKVAGFFIGVLLQSVISGVAGVVQAVKGAFQIVIGIFGLFKNILTGNWKAAWNSLLTILKGVWNLIIGSLKVYFAVGVVKIFGLGFSLIKGIFINGWRFILGLFKGSLGAIGNVVRGGMNMVRSVIGAVMRGIWAVIKGAWNLIVSVVRGYIRAYVTVIKTAFNLVKSFIGSILRGIVSIFRNGFSTMLNAGRSAMSAIRNAISSAFNAIISKIKSAASSMIGSIRNGFNTIVSTARSGGSRLLSAIRNAVGKAVSAVKELPGKAKSALGNLGSMLFNAGKDFIQGFINGIKNMAGAAIGAAGDIASGAVDKVKGFLHIGSPSKVMEQIGKWTSEGFAEGIKAMSSKVAAATEVTAAVVPRQYNAAIPNSRVQPSVQSVTNSGPLIGQVTVNPAQGMSEAEVARQTTIRIGQSMLGRSVPIPAPAGGY